MISDVVFKPGFRFDPKEKVSGADPIDFKELFGNSYPVEIEIGCGKGAFLVAMALENSERNYLGIDIAGKWMRKGENKGRKQELNNLKFLKVETRHFLLTVPDKSVEMFHIYFPDPWPKRRHRERRIINELLLEVLFRKLKPGGVVEIATDDAPYFDHIQEAVDACKSLWKKMRKSVNERLFCPHLKTNYESKWHEQGRDLFYMELRKS